jgi:hypothetical protein
VGRNPERHPLMGCFEDFILILLAHLGWILAPLVQANGAEGLEGEDRGDEKDLGKYRGEGTKAHFILVTFWSSV